MPADQQGCHALDGLQLPVFEQRRRQAAESGVVFDDQYGSTFLLRLPHDQAAPLSVRRPRHSMSA